MEQDPEWGSKAPCDPGSRGEGLGILGPDRGSEVSGRCACPVPCMCVWWGGCAGVCEGERGWCACPRVWRAVRVWCVRARGYAYLTVASGAPCALPRLVTPSKWPPASLQLFPVEPEQNSAELVQKCIIWVQQIVDGSYHSETAAGGWDDRL